MDDEGEGWRNVGLPIAVIQDNDTGDVILLLGAPDDLPQRLNDGRQLEVDVTCVGPGTLAAVNRIVVCTAEYVERATEEAKNSAH